MEKILKYTLTPDGAFPEETLCGGVQGENRATAIVFEAESKLSEKINEYKKQGKTIEAKIKAVTAAGECVSEETKAGENLFSPFYLTGRVTSSGLDVIIIFSLIIIEEQKELCKAQIRLSFIPSPISSEFGADEKTEAQLLLKKAEELFAELDEKADNIGNTMDQKLDTVKNTASLTAEQLKKATEIANEAEKTRLSLESGMEFVFSGGDAFQSALAELVIDDELSENSINPVANKAVTQSFSQQMQEIDSLKEKDELHLSEIEALKANDQLHSKDIGELKVDYIVEQSESGIWTYRKWASGIAECWGTINIQFDKEVANKWIGEDGVEDSGFYGLGEIPQSNITFPFDFVETPLVDVVLQSTPCTVFIAKNSSNNSPLRNTGEIRVYRPLKFPDYVFDREFVFGYSVKGRWK